MHCLDLAINLNMGRILRGITIDIVISFREKVPIYFATSSSVYRWRRVFLNPCKPQRHGGGSGNYSREG